MSDEESFVILGSSPMSSLENDGLETRHNSNVSSLQSDTPGSRFTSLKNSQIIDLKNAQEIPTKTTNCHQIESNMAEPVMRASQKNLNQTTQMSESTKTKNTQELDEEIAASKLWSRPPVVVQEEESILPLNLEDCALKSPIYQQQQQKHNADENVQQKSFESVDENLSSNKRTGSLSGDRNLAASFIMGEVDSDVLKTSVYSQFPSISVDACPEDVLKLQNLVTEYSELKSTIKKANNTMKLFYHNSLQWKEKMKIIEERYKEQLDNCQKEIEELRKQNNETENSFKRQIEALEIARKKDREENIQEISEKNALLENMRAQIIKLEQQQMASFEFVLQNQDEQQNDELKHFYITSREHEIKIKNLQKQLSEMLASNLDYKDVEKQYIDELTCLKVNLTAAEELIDKNRAEIAELTAINIEKQKQMQKLEISLQTLQLAFEEQKERISLLEAQNEVHRTDFEIEKQSRETAVKEKQQILQDLRSLQRRNHELIEEHQKLADAFQKRISNPGESNEMQIAAASVAANKYYDNPQRPIRVLPSPSPPATVHMCPICNKAFKSLNILLSHVNACVDKN